MRAGSDARGRMPMQSDAIPMRSDGPDALGQRQLKLPGDEGDSWRSKLRGSLLQEAAELTQEWVEPIVMHPVTGSGNVDRAYRAESVGASVQQRIGRS